MTELIISGTRAVLPKDFSFSLFDENPVITKRGEFSLDITLSLLHPVNARIFGHINRLNILTPITEASATLIVDNVPSNGKIVDIKNSDSTVTFQFVAGNSEINYISSDSKKIWDFDWGTEIQPTLELALRSLQYPGYGPKRKTSPIVLWTQNYVCVPVKLSNVIANEYLTYNYDINTPTIYQSFQIYDVKNIVIQPYLLYYINKLPQVLGFTLGTNVLNSDEKCKKIYLTNNVQTLNYADFLPDKTITEFIESIEALFNVSFEFDKYNRTCNIVSRKAKFDNAEFVELAGVTNKFETEVSETLSNNSLSFEYLSYTMDKNGFNKLARLQDDVRSACEVLEYEDIDALISAVVEANKNKLIIYKTTNDNRSYIYTDDPAEINLKAFHYHIPGKSGFLILVDRFISTGTNPQNNYILPIKPAEITIEYQKKEWREYLGGDWYEDCYYQLPVINSNLFTVTNQEILDAIGNELISIPRQSDFVICMYNGMTKINMFYGAFEPNGPFYWHYPQSFVDQYPYFGVGYYGDENNIYNWIEDEFMPICNDTLRLNNSDGIFEEYYNESTLVDLTRKYIFNIINNSNLSVNNFYTYQNAKYIPASFEKQVTTDGIDKKIIAVFYRIK